MAVAARMINVIALDVMKDIAKFYNSHITCPGALLQCRVIKIESKTFFGICNASPHLEQDYYMSVFALLTLSRLSDFFFD